MNQEVQLKLQSYLDGELSAADRSEVETLLTQDASASALFSELSNTRVALKGNELEMRLPETREFYWSQIRREIERLESPARVRPSARVSWQSLFSLPRLAAVAACAMIGLFLFNQQDPATFAHVREVDAPSDEMGSITFRSEAEKMTVVYLFDREPAALADAGTLNP